MRSAVKKVYEPERQDPDLILVRWGEIYLTNELTNVIAFDDQAVALRASPIETIGHPRLTALFEMCISVSDDHDPVLSSTFAKLLWSEPPLLTGAGVHPKHFNAALAYCINYHLITKLIQLRDPLHEGHWHIIDNLIAALRTGNVGVGIESTIVVSSIKSKDGKASSTKDFIAAIVVCLTLLSVYDDIKLNAVEVITDIRWIISVFAKLAPFEAISLDLGGNDEDIPDEIVAFIDRRRRDGPSSMFVGRRTLLDDALFDSDGHSRLD